MLSPKTVRNHVSNIFSKLQVTDRAQAIVRACVRARRESAGCTVWSADKPCRSTVNVCRFSLGDTSDAPLDNFRGLAQLQLV